MKLKKISEFYLLVLAILTAGFYVPLWFIFRRESFERMNTKKELGMRVLVLATIYFGIRNIVLIVLLTKGGWSIFDICKIVGTDPVATILGMLLVFPALRVRSILLDNFKDLKLSWVWTLLLGIFYLQHKINNDLE